MANVFNKFLNMIGIGDEDDDELDYYDDEPRQAYEQPHAPQPRAPKYPAYAQPVPGGNQKRGGKVVAHPSFENSVKHQTTIYQINEHSETRAVIDDLLVGKSVLLNLENLDAVESQRVIDTLSGAAYAIDATLKKAAHQTYYIAPASVEIAGSFTEESAKPARPSSNLFKSRED